jgi:hypothetical protein
VEHNLAGATGDAAPGVPRQTAIMAAGKAADLTPIRWSVLFGLYLALPGTASAQRGPAVTSKPVDGLTRAAALQALRGMVSRDQTGPLTVTATPLVEAIVVDGRLDEPIYAQVPAAGGFIQQEPSEGEAATERTDAWVFYDGQNVYVAARCWDSEPERMVANELRRDNRSIAENESFAVVLDTFNDRRNAFFFQTNALGALRDGLITDERTANFDWNAVWDVKTRRFDKGWTLEMAIPFKSLRYASDPQQAWGINLLRFVRWKNERSYLSPIPASYGPDGIYRVSSAATLAGLRISSGTRHLELKPYAISVLETNTLATPPLTNDLSGDAGFDAKYNVTGGLTADFTYNTDFAQVEADEEQVNLTRFNLFFPEKREFFLEGQGIFDFGGPARSVWGRPSNTPVVFFSRRIGLQGGQPIPIRAGGRITGRAGQYSIGAVSMRSVDVERNNVPATAFSVLRLRRSIFRRSTVGLIGTHRSVTAAGSGSNQVYGADVSLAFFRDLSITGYWTRSQTPGRTGRDHSYRTRLENVGDRYGIEYEHLVVGEDFNPEIGFLRRQDFRRNYAGVQFTPRPTSVPAVRKFRHEASIDNITDMEGRLESRELRGVWAAEFQRGDEVSFEYNRNLEFLPEPFEISKGVVLPVAEYPFQSLKASLRLGPQRTLNGWLSLKKGSFFGGDVTEAFFSGRVELTSRLSVEPRISVSRVNLPQGRFTTQVLMSRVSYSMTPRSFVSALIQYNSGTATLSTNVRLRWEYEPGSELFIVYGDGRNTDIRGFPSLQNRGLVVKLTRLFRF